MKLTRNILFPSCRVQGLEMTDCRGELMTAGQVSGAADGENKGEQKFILLLKSPEMKITFFPVTQKAIC